MAVVEPDLSVERAFFAGGSRLVIGLDEVGRGALAGPVAVGAAVIAAKVSAVPKGLRDSKLIPEAKRSGVESDARAWAEACGVGLASAAEVDQDGIIAALGLAARRVLEELHRSGVPVTESVVLLDGTHDWLSPVLRAPLRVVTRAKADRDCGSVAAASVIAKVHRDSLMIRAHDEQPVYHWLSNKGYASAAHFAALAEHGASAMHRRTWLRTAPDIPA
ncbi:ribonuclease HII [Ruicaihuangia caeni]|uniref:Ribonuclease n=1 Tax=Ruicaihuangia caeni TaxID=3042517 RepID=A0AAW6T3Q8_9MICO|nr:ribonuclease HII [Klugiella sp. YN-L-19]MDI2097711.1 ribonuclease HII [Klugiella sp. YN-L-19]